MKIIIFFSIIYHANVLDENVIGLSLQEILPDNNNIKPEKMLVANPPNILKKSKSLKIQNAVSVHKKKTTNQVNLLRKTFSI